MELQHIRLDVASDFVATVTLDKPPVNALGRAIRDELIWVIDSLHDRDDVRAVVLTGAGRVFCAGADIKEKRALGDAPGTQARSNRLIREAFYCLMDCAKPIIAAVNGPALGAGMVMATCCDIIFAAESAVFAMPEIDVGLGGGASFLQRVLPPTVFRSLLLTGERVSAAELHRLGVVKECVPDDALMGRALALARAIATKSPIAVRMLKGSFGAVETMSLRDGYRMEQEVTTALSRTEDSKEAQRAFVEKRPPRFVGR
jgi:enoyl-CoA hydratase